MSKTPRTDAEREKTLNPKYEYVGAESEAWSWAEELEQELEELKVANEISMTREDIVKKYPKIFVDEYIEAPVAWLPVIDELCDCMESYGYSQYSTDKGVIQFPQVVCDQVKSKFSQLRFYYHFEYEQEDIPVNIYNDHRKYVDGMIAYAETRIRRL